MWPCAGRAGGHPVTTLPLALCRQIWWAPSHHAPPGPVQAELVGTQSPRSPFLELSAAVAGSRSQGRLRGQPRERMDSVGGVGGGGSP